MNQKGIILSGLIYALLTFFLLLLASILFVLWNRQNAVDRIKDEANNVFNNTVPLVQTNVDDIVVSGTRAKISGRILLDGGSDITERGVVYSTNIDPDVTGDKVIVAGTVGSFAVNIADLESNKTYYARVYAKNNIGVSYGDGVVFSTNVFVNVPELVNGMTPIKWNGTSWEETTEDDISWYDYANKKWANAKTADGSMWVWIPRYIYKISSGWHSSTTGTIDVQFSKGTIDNWNSASIGDIDTGTTAEASNNKWTNHPGFTFGDDELTGIWVAKFEASDDGANNVKLIPNVSAWRDMTIGEIFDKCRSMELNTIYGWGTTGTGIDTHLMKNTEWGVAAYLSKSIYGKNSEEVWTNPTSNYTTGCAGDTVSAEWASCNQYNTINGVKASTTGTIYGVYDMSGGGYDHVSAYIDNGNSSLTTYGASILNAEAKYKNVYIMGDSDTRSLNYAANQKKGDALYETSSSGEGSTSWFNDYSYLPVTSVPWFTRGGYYGNGSDAGAFAFMYANGFPYGYYGFRPVLVVGDGL